MTSCRKILTFLVLALAPMAHAAAESGSASDQQARYQDEALKSCNYDLDHDRFGSYATVDDCVADRAEKLSRQAKNGSAHAGPAEHQPN
jgi:hypothetical protein